MQDIPDAPYIREAETYGMPPYGDVPDPVCPVCRRECVTIYALQGEAVGCDECLEPWDASEWYERHTVD